MKQAEWCEEQAANAGQYAERSAALYIEFAQATLGKRAVVVSQGLRLKDEEKAAEEDPAAKALMLDTRSFLRGQDQWLEDGTESN